MGAITIPEPDPGILGKRERILEGLRAILPGENLITDPRELVPYETDGFTAYARVPMAVVLPETVGSCRAVHVPVDGSKTSRTLEGVDVGPAHPSAPPPK